MTESARTHPVVLTTRTSYAIPSSKYMIPTSWARYHLSQLINKVLSAARPIPFDFLINGNLLTGSLADWCNEHAIGEEETLEIEYIESVLPPEAIYAQETDDWMTSISCRYKGFFLTSSYDGCVRVHDNMQQPIATISHPAPITSACWVTSHSSPEEKHLIASASLDHTLRLTELLGSSSPSGSIVASLHLHTAPVASVSASPDGRHLLSAGWDGLVGLWTTTVPTEDQVHDVQEIASRKKRRKLDDGLLNGVKKGPVAVLKSHTARVSKALFDSAGNGSRAYSCGWDSTVRSWDVESGVCTSTVMLPDRALLSLALSTNSTLYSAATDRTVSLLDLRIDGAQSISRTLTHPSTASCLATHPESAYHLLTGAYDGALRVWDIRSPQSALAKFDHFVKGKEGAVRRGKILDVDWAHGLAACAGEAGLGIWRAGVGGAELEQVPVN